MTDPTLESILTPMQRIDLARSLLHSAFKELDTSDIPDHPERIDDAITESVVYLMGDDDERGDIIERIASSGLLPHELIGEKYDDTPIAELRTILGR